MGFGHRVDSDLVRPGNIIRVSRKLSVLTSNTTDPQDEHFDLYDSWGKPLKTSKPRGDVHRDGDWHRSLHLWLWGVESSKPFILFQRRSMTKDTWPGVLDVAVGGHFRSGETLAETLREAEEELGLDVGVDDIVRIGRRFFVWRTENYTDSEIAEAFAVRCDQPLTEFRLHPEEVDGLARISAAEGLKLFDGQVSTITGVEYIRETGNVRTVELAVADFVEASDGYAVQTLSAIQQLAAGQHPQPFVIRTLE